MVNPEESQDKDEKGMSAADTENDLGEEDKDDRVPVGEDDVNDLSRVSERLYQTDSLHLRNILPNELWLLILDMLNDSPEDWRNCVNASPYFWQLQRGQRVFTLFPDVFDVLVKQFEPREWFKKVNKTGVNQENGTGKVDDVVEDDRDEFDVDDDDDTDEDDVADDDANDDNADDDDDDDANDVGMDEESKKWINAVLNCRRVCKSWNKAIESCYSRPDMSGIPDFNSDPDPRSPVNLMNGPWIGGKLRIYSTRKAEKFMEQFGKSHHSGERVPPKNPVLGRYLWIDMNEFYDGAEAALNSLNTVAKVLKMFGKEVWYTRISVPSHDLTDDQFYLRIREWICLMPNLKYLQFEEVWSPAKASPAVIAANPMPKLDNILIIHINYRCGGSIINEVIRANAHVPHLKVWESDIDEEILALLSNLSAFSTNESTSFDVKMMGKYGSNWKLNKACVDNYSDDLKGMFQILENNWANTLTDLRLSLSDYGDARKLNGSKDARLNLPNLRRLHVNIQDQDYILLDFILPLANTLEYLEIECYHPNGGGHDDRDKRDAEVKKQTIQFVGYEERMHQSNIWQIFKKLKTIKMEWIDKWEKFAVYTREGDKITYIHEEKLHGK